MILKQNVKASRQLNLLVHSSVLLYRGPYAYCCYIILYEMYLVYLCAAAAVGIALHCV